MLATTFIISSMDVLVFELHHNRYALPAAAIIEIDRAVAITPVAGAPRAVEGVFNLRGTIVPVVDVRARFGLEPRPLDPSQHFVIVRVGARPVALRVDRADALMQVDATSIASARDAVPSARDVAGIAALEDGMVVIYDVDAFFTQAESEALAPTLAAMATS